jgi:osmotically-inducible protein OsmY
MAITPVSDRSIISQVTNKLAGRGLCAPCKLVVASRNGEVTLSGTVHHAHQKGTAVQVAAQVGGVRRVIDRLTVKVPARF